MAIGPKQVVTLEYTLKNDKGEVLDASEGGEPLAYLHGASTIIPGLEKALEGKNPGDTLQVTVGPDEAYGQRDEKLVQNMPVRKLPEKKIVAGMQFRVQTEQGPRFLTVKSVKGDYATVDLNHPLAGMTLHFDVKVASIRDATEEEIAHGHVHPPGHEH